MSSSNSDDVNNESVKKRKGVVNTDKYKRNVIRKSRVRGIAYQSYSGKEIQCKVQQTHQCRCVKKCYSDISEESRLALWNYFYSLESKNMQDTYLQSLIELRGLKRKRKYDKGPDNGERENTKKPKQTFFSYNLKIDGKIRTVCKNTFMKLYGVTPGRVRRISNLLVSGKIPQDLRGLGRSGNYISDETRLKIHNHISKYETKETHYGGKPKYYLDSGLSMIIMHQLFLEEHPECVPTVKYNFFRQYFKEKFDYSFGQPKVDNCLKCERFLVKLKDPILGDSAERTATGEQMVHKC